VGGRGSWTQRYLCPPRCSGSTLNAGLMSRTRAARVRCVTHVVLRPVTTLLRGWRAGTSTHPFGPSASMVSSSKLCIFMAARFTSAKWPNTKSVYPLAKANAHVRTTFNAIPWHDTAKGYASNPAPAAEMNKLATAGATKRSHIHGGAAVTAFTPRLAKKQRSPHSGLVRAPLPLEDVNQ